MIEPLKKTLIIGANGTIGSAFVEQLSDCCELYTLSRQDTDYSDDDLNQHANYLKTLGPFNSIICCIGSLHNQRIAPEKRLAQLSKAVLEEYFLINTILPALCLKHFSGLLDKTHPSKFIALSAMVGSIADNKLGGWYGYRSSKAALNMMIKTASIEVARTNKQACLAVVHPGTTQGSLSRPFAAGVAKDKYYTPAQSAERIWALTQRLQPQQSGSFFNWDGSQLPW